MLARWLERARLEGGASGRAATALIEQPGAGVLLEAVFGSSPFLGAALIEELPFAVDIFARGPDRAIEGAMAELSTGGVRLEEGALMRALRLARRRVALAVALADIGGAWELTRVTCALSDFAEAALRLAVAHLLRAAGDRGELTLPHPEEPEIESGFILIAMGKLGARELNYSSDIDLIVLYDRDRVRYAGRRGVEDCFVRMTHGLVRLLQDRTADGYVFRVDLRLRPDPGIDPARPLRARGGGLLREHGPELGARRDDQGAARRRRPRGRARASSPHLRPFVWRENLDFAAIRDIHSIKRQIHAHKGHGAIAVGGHNIKLGRGGIREIEFFAQTQQLIWGGRMPELRVARHLRRSARAGARRAHAARTRRRD